MCGDSQFWVYSGVFAHVQLNKKMNKIFNTTFPQSYRMKWTQLSTCVVTTICMQFMPQSSYLRQTGGLQQELCYYTGGWPWKKSGIYSAAWGLLDQIWTILAVGFLLHEDPMQLERGSYRRAAVLQKERIYKIKGTLTIGNSIYRCVGSL